MKYISIGFLLTLPFFLFSCEQRSQVDYNASSSSIHGGDSARVVQQVSQQKDSILQELEEITLHAVGNTKEEIKFDQDTLEVKPGARVLLKLINEGTEQSMIHNIVITEHGYAREVALAGAKIGASGNYVPKSAKVIAASPLALPGQEVSIAFTAPVNPVVYDFICTYSDHFHRMHGKLIVKK